MKSAHSGRNVILLYLTFLILASCDYPVYDIINQSTVEVIPEDEIEDTETDDIIIIEEVPTMELKPIKEFSHYVTLGKKVYGIDQGSLEEVILIDSDDKPTAFNKFFTIEGMIYLSVIVMEAVEPDGEPSGVEYFFSQTGDKISEKPSKDFPGIPQSVRIEHPKDKVFEIQKTMYGDIETSTIIKGTLQEAHLMIDGCARVSTGMWFSSPETYSFRLKGVYFWPDNNVKTRLFADGRIW